MALTTDTLLTTDTFMVDRTGSPPANAVVAVTVGRVKLDRALLDRAAAAAPEPQRGARRRAPPAPRR